MIAGRDPYAARSDLAAGLGPNEAPEHFPELDARRPRGDDRVTGGEGAQLVLVVRLDHAQPPRPGAVNDGTKDHHLPRLDVGLPVCRVPTHDLAFLVTHVESEVGARCLQSEDERA